MAQVNFNSIQMTENNNINTNNVGFFSLKNDGDTALVRFMHDDVSSFELYTVHNITIGDRYRKINCLREPEEPFDRCPLCAQGEKVQQRFFIHLIQYVQDENGRIVGLPKVWERSATYAHKLKNLMDEYGPLSDYVFKIKRNGVARSMDTSYDILFCNPATYDTTQYPKNFEAFSNYKALGSIVMDKSFEDINVFLNTGNFPEVVRNEQRVTTTPNNIPNNIPTNYASINTASYTPVRDNMVSGQFGNQNTFTPTPRVDTNMNNMYNNTQAVQRPVRSYTV